MSITVPRAEIRAVGRRHSIDYDLDFDPTVEWVRATAASLRSNQLRHREPGYRICAYPASPECLAEADDLDPFDAPAVARYFKAVIDGEIDEFRRAA